MHKKKYSLFVIVVLAILVATFSCVNNKSNSKINISAKKFMALGTSNITNKINIRDVVYYGNTGEYKIIENTGIGSQIYSNSNKVFSNIPYQYNNSEMIQLPETDKTLLATDGTFSSTGLITFTTFRESYVVILRDPNVTLPSWISSNGYVLNTNLEFASSTTDYNAYVKTVAANTNVVIGTNIDLSSDLNGGNNQVVLIKEKNKVDNYKFIDENFDDFDSPALLSGFNATYPPNISFTKDTFFGRECIELHDQSDAYIGTINKYFVPQSGKFAFEYDAYVPSDNTYSNTWLRAFLSNGQFITSVSGGIMDGNVNYKDSLILESYLTKNSSVLQVNIKDSSNSTLTLGSTTLNEWHSYKYVMDYDVQSFTLYIDGVKASGADNGSIVKKLFRKLNVSSVNMLQIGTGYSTKSKYYVDNVKVYPVMDVGISSIVVNGRSIEIDKDITDYNVLTALTPTESTYSVVETDYFHDISIDSTTYPNRTVVTVTNDNLETFTFNLIFGDYTILADYDIRGDNTLINAEMKDNVQVIHVLDTSSTKHVYFEKSFDSINSALRFSYDVFFENNSNVNNEDIISFLSNTQLGDIQSEITDYTKLGLRSYFDPIGISSNIGVSLFSYDTDSSTYTENEDSTIITKNTWHNISYELNIVDKTVDIYIDNILIFDNLKASFLSNVSSIDNMIIGSSYAGTADFYVKNINIEELNGAPIESINIDSSSLLGFDKNNSSFTFYTDNELTSESVVTFTTNAFYKSTVGTNIDVVNKTITITVIDNLDNTVIYTIYFDDLINKPVSKSDLLLLINIVSELSSNSSAYTTYTWNKVYEYNLEAINCYDDINTTESELSIIYYRLHQAISNLQLYVDYDDSEEVETSEYNNTTKVMASTTFTKYEASLISTIKMSNNLDTKFRFNKVLQNHGNVSNTGEVYKDSSSLFFNSIPYKYMNSEYIVMNNEIINNGTIKMTAKQDIYLLVFKDWDAGPFTKSISVDGNNHGFTYTGEIATTNDGSVYKIYSTAILKGSIFELDTNTIFNNPITNKNNIVAFAKKYNVDNNYFFYENMNDYDDTDLFSKSWTSLVSHFGNSTNNSTNTIEGTNPNKYLQIKSFAADSMPIIIKEFAELNEKIKYNFSYYTDSANTVANNDYLRVWLVCYDYDSRYGISGGGDDDRVIALADLYTSSTAPKYVYTYNGRAYQITAMNGFSFSQDNWYDYEYVYDFSTRKYTTSVGNHGGTLTNVTPGTKNLFQDFSNLTFANHSYFSGRGSTGSTSRVNFVKITPIESDIFTGMNVSYDSLTNFNDYTKAYLYTYTNDKASILTNVSPIAGSVLSTITTDDSLIDGGGVNTYNNTKYTHVFADTDEYDRNYYIYYESTDNNIRSVLVDTLDEALSYNSVLYTVSSYNDLTTQIINAKSILANQSATESQITTANDLLQEAIDNLILRMDFKLNYKGKAKPGYNYGDFIGSEIDITTQSSLTANFTLYTRASDTGYIYDGLIHNRYLVSDLPFPEGTLITFEDYSNTIPSYYKYEVTAQDVLNNKTKYALLDFIKIGTTDKHFDGIYAYYDDESRIISNKFNFIVNFGNASMSTGLHNLHMELYVDNNLDDIVSTSDVIQYMLYDDEVEYSISANLNSETITPSDFVHVNLVTNFILPEVDGVNVIDTRLASMHTGIKVSLYDSTGTVLIGFGKGTYVDGNNIIHYLDNDNKFRAIDEVNNTSSNLQYDIYSEFDSFVVGNYKIKIELLSSVSGLSDTDVKASEWLDLSISHSSSCSVRGTVTNSSGYFDLSNDNLFTLAINAGCDNVAEDKVITAELFRKVSSAFTSDEFISINKSEYLYPDETIIQGETANEYVQGVIPASEGINGYVSTLKSFHVLPTLQPGTYRLLIKIKSTNHSATDTVDFVIK